MVLFPHWWEVDPLQEPYQDAVALVELGVAFLAHKLGEPRVPIQWDPNQLLEVHVERVKQKGGLGRGIQILNNILCPLEGMSQAAWREFSMAEAADGGIESACWNSPRWVTPQSVGCRTWSFQATLNCVSNGWNRTEIYTWHNLSANM